jgi:hypothetical protein
MNDRPHPFKIMPIEMPKPVENWSVEMQGKRLEVKCYDEFRQKTNHGTKRKEIVEFSRRARSRWLRDIASINWRKCNDCQFLTLTYPDQVANHTMEQRKTHRYLINRFITKIVGYQRSVFWRVEWMPRLSGVLVGEMMPHMHLLYIDCPKICEMKIRLRWMEIIRVRQYTQVKIKQVANAEVASVYAAKYCAKLAPSLLLDNVPKRNRTGRHAGRLRRSLIPYHPVEMVKRLDKAILDYLRAKGCEMLWWYDDRYDESFTIIGDRALEIIKEFKEICVENALTIE